MKASEFIVKYMDYYVIMAYRKLINKIDLIQENKLISNLYRLLDEYSEEDIKQYFQENQIK